MLAYDGDGKQLSIHAIIGSLRSRILDLKSGNYTKGYELQVYSHNGMQYYEPYLNVGLYIHSYSPTEISENLKPLLIDLNSIKRKHLAHLDNESEEFSEKPTYTGLLEEIHFYRVQISKLLDQYRRGDNGPFFTLRYELEAPARWRKLDNFHKAILSEISAISLDDIYAIFSGEMTRVENPIDWQGRINEVVYLIRELTARTDITMKGKKWDTISNCFSYRGDPVTIDDRGNYRIYSSERRNEINSMLDRLN